MRSVKPRRVACVQVRPPIWRSGRLAVFLSEEQTSLTALSESTATIMGTLASSCYGPYRVGVSATVSTMVKPRGSPAVATPVIVPRPRLARQWRRRRNAIFQIFSIQETMSTFFTPPTDVHAQMTISSMPQQSRHAPHADTFCCAL